VPSNESNPQPSPIEQRLAEELKEYNGKWVAVSNDQLVGSGETAREAIDEALAAGHTDPLIFRVSTHPERVAFL
jgi:alkanesulfonate monooxygenase SsuD/methylene tetrahydromethanopterin reductase-like flavin-dependent oxidoreductase (luciferase family)